jgi:hypothetical protein
MTENNIRLLVCQMKMKDRPEVFYKDILQINGLDLQFVLSLFIDGI